MTKKFRIIETETKIDGVVKHTKYSIEGKILNLYWANWLIFSDAPTKLFGLFDIACEGLKYYTKKDCESFILKKNQIKTVTRRVI